jgi:hypothetical protein
MQSYNEFARSAGYAAVWCYSEYKPVKNPVGRDDVPAKWKEDAEAWQQGYDGGMKQVNSYREGRAFGLTGQWKPEGKDDAWRRGWHVGYCKHLRSKLVPILKAAPKLDTIVCETWYPDYDDREGVEYAGGQKYTRLTKKQLLSTVVEGLSGRWGKDATVPTTVEEMKEIFLNENEHDYGHVRLMSVKDMKKEKADAEYARIERAAQAFAGRCKAKLGTMAFLAALDREVNKLAHRRERWNDGETRMEEWAACMYSGAGSETYFDDLNYVNGQMDSEAASLEDVYAYIERKFPILFMRYQERKARKAKK